MTQLKPKEGAEMSEIICKHCGGDIEIRNPSGYCDHLHYPENCDVCKGKMNEIKRAVEFISKAQEILDEHGGPPMNESWKIIFSLAERYLACEGWPEPPNYCSCMEGHCSCDEIKRTIDACRLAHLKDKEKLRERCSVYEIEKMIAKHHDAMCDGHTLAIAIFKLIEGDSK